MTEKDTINYLRNFGKKLDESEFRLKKVEDLLKLDPKNGITIKGPIHYSGGLFPIGSTDIGNRGSFVKDLYLSGKIIYPDVLELGVNNDFRIDKMGKIGLHIPDKLDGVTIKGLPSFVIQNVSYVGDDILFFQLSKGSIEEFITKQDVLLIEGEQYQALFLSTDKIEIGRLDGKKVELEVGRDYDMVVYNNVFGIRSYKDDDILKVNAFGDIFYKTTSKKGDVNINGKLFSSEILSDKLDVKSLNILDDNAPLVPNLNAEFLCGKKPPSNGELVTTKDKQMLWNKTFGDDLIMNHNRIVNLCDPLYELDAVTKRYVDRYLSGIRVAASVRCASVLPIDVDYEKREMKLHFRSSSCLDSEEFIKIFDGIKLEMNNRCIILHQLDERQNGVYMVVSDGLVSGRVVLQRVYDFSGKRSVDDLKSYYTFIEGGERYGNTGVIFDYYEGFDWEDGMVRFNLFSRAESYGVGGGIRKVNNNFMLNVGEEFELGDKLEIKRGKIGNEYLRNDGIGLIGEGGIDLERSLIKLGENVKLGLRVDRSQFHFGKNGELRMSVVGREERELENLSVGRNISAMSFQNVYQLFPPVSFISQLQYSEDYFEIEKDKTVQYYICSLNSEGMETNYRAGDEYYFSDEVKSIFSSLSWDVVKGCDGYKIYRRINSAYFYVKLSNVETSLLDVLVPRAFTKIDWKPCDEPGNINETVLVVNKFSTGGASYITGGSLGIGTVNPEANLHVLGDSGVPLILEGSGEMLRMVGRGLGGGVKVVGECMEGRGELELGRNVRLVVGGEGVIFLGRGEEVMNINDKLGSDEYVLQVDGGIYSVGDMMIGEGRSIGSYNSKLGNNALIMRTGCVSNSVANQVSFIWEGDELKAVPLQDGTVITRKKVSVKNFTIDHPVDRERYLVHACLEGATADVFYRGKDSIGVGYDYVDIMLPDYYGKLVKVGTSTLQLTVIGRPICRLGGEVYEEECRVRVYLGHICREVVNFYWEVKGERVDTDFDCEPRREDVRVMGMGPYTYYL